MYDLYQNNYTNLVCDAKHVNDTYILSKLCVNGSDDGTLDCLPHNVEERQMRFALGLWAVLILIIGVLGNTLTLLAIPYAARKKR